MINSLHNNSNRISVRINNMNNLAYEGTSKIDEHIVDGKSCYTWKTVIPFDYVVNGSWSCLVSANRANGSPFGGPLEEGETRVVSYSLNQGKTWKEIPNDNTEVKIGNTGLSVYYNPTNTSFLNLHHNENPDLYRDMEVVFKVEMTYDSPATPHPNYMGPEYVDVILEKNPNYQKELNAKNLQFFDANGYNLNFEWSENGYWEGTIYLPKVSVGLYANTSIYILEQLDLSTLDTYYNEHFDEANSIDNTLFNDEYFFPTGSGTITFKWDPINTFVDEFFLFDFDDSYTIKETSALVYTPNDGPDCNTLAVNTFDEYEINLDDKFLSKALPVHVAFMANEKYDATTYNRTLIMYYDGQVIARIKFFAETVEEDERLKIWNANLGYNITPEDEMIFYTSDIKEYRPDYILLNEKRKELMMEGSNIYPYIGSYKAIINAIKFFGYSNLNIIEYWRNVNPDDVNFGKIYHSSKYSLTKKETLNIGARNIVLPNKNYKKINALALVYSINKMTGEIDEWELPKVKEEFTYTIEEALIKLFALRKKLNKEFMPGTSRIIDIIGEAHYFGIQALTKIHDQQDFQISETPLRLDFDIEPKKYVHITDNEYFNRYINFKIKNDSSDSDTEIPLRDQLISDISSNTLESLSGEHPYYEDGSRIPETLETLSNNEKCDWFREYYREVFVDYTVNKAIEDNDDYPFEDEEYNYTDPYSRFTAKIVLTNKSFDESSFENCDLKFNCKYYDMSDFSGSYNYFSEENTSTYDITFDNIDEFNKANRISWTIRMSNNQIDEDLKNIGIQKSYKRYDFVLSTQSEDESSDNPTFVPVKEYNQFFAELPYVGYYDVTLKLAYYDESTGEFKNKQEKTLLKYIKVEPYNIELKGFYYDARELPKELAYDNPEGSIMYNFIQENISKMTGWAITERTAPDFTPIAFSMYTTGTNGEVLNPGPYHNDYMDDEWYLADNISVEMDKLKPFVKYARYIRNGVDVKPFTWFLLGYEYSKIAGKINPKWTITNNEKNAPYPGPDGTWIIGDINTFIDVTDDQTPHTGPNGNWFIGDQDTKIPVTSITHYYEGHYLTMLLKKEGNYTVTLTLEDKNGNEYSISRNIIVVSKSANYNLYQTFKKEYDYMTEEEMLKNSIEFYTYDKDGVE